MDETEFESLKKEIINLCKLNGVDEQVIDLDMEIDRNLTKTENYNILKENYNLKDKNYMKEFVETTKDRLSYEQWERIKEDGFSLFEKHNPFFVAIIGSRGSGKTAFAHKTVDKLRKIRKIPIYTYKYPKEKLLVRIGYKNLKELRELEYLNNIILWMDEPQLTLKRYDRKNNQILMELISICRQRDIILVISTSDTRWINRALESYVDVWVIKDVDFEMIKQGSRAKYVIKQNATLDPQAFKLEPEEYLLYYRKDSNYQGKFKFTLPKYWSEEYSKPYMKSEGETPKETEPRTSFAENPAKRK